MFGRFLYFYEERLRASIHKKSSERVIVCQEDLCGAIINEPLSRYGRSLLPLRKDSFQPFCEAKVNKTFFFLPWTPAPGPRRPDGSGTRRRI